MRSGWCSSCEPRRAVDRAEDATLHPRDGGRGYGEHRVRAGNPDEDGSAPLASREECSLHRLGPPRRLDRIVDSASRHLAHDLGSRLCGSLPLDLIRRAELARDLELLRRCVDSDDRLRPDRDCRHERRQSHSPAADDGYAISFLHAGGSPHRSRARRHGAADQRGDIERNVSGDRNARSLGDDAGVREGREERVVVDGLAVARQPRGPVEETAACLLYTSDAADEL